MHKFIFIDDLTEAQIIAALSEDVPRVSFSHHGRGNTLLKIGSGFDCETTTTKRAKMSYVYIWQMSINDRCYMGRTCAEYERFLHILDDFLVASIKRVRHGKIKDFPQLYVWDANLGYEWAHFKRVFERVGIRTVFAKSDRHPLAIGVGRCIMFRECLGLFGYSLANIAHTYTQTQKRVGDIRYDLPRHSGTPLTKKELGYCINDVMILSELSFVAFQMFDKKRIPYTATGIIRAEIKENIYSVGKKNYEFCKFKTRKQMPDNMEDYTLITKNLYSGGLSHSNYKYVRRVVENVLCADLVSDFPAQMIHRDFPAGKLCSNLSLDDLRKARHWYAQITFYNLRSRTGHSIISRHKCLELEPAEDKHGNLVSVEIDNGRVYTAGICTVLCTEVDFENILLIYDADRAVFADMHAFTQSKKCPEHITQAVREYYGKKQEIKATKLHKTTKKKDYEESKRKLNGIYGMTATHIYTKEIVFDSDSLHDLKEVDKNETFDKLTENLWLSPWIAIYTTAYARNILCKLISKYPDIIIQYDTDSIYFLDGRPESEALKAEIEKHNEVMQQKNRDFFGDTLFDDLGKWEYDPPIQKMKTLGAKRYLYLAGGKYKFVCAGAKKSAFFAYCKKHGKKPFDFFDRKMFLPPLESDKTTLIYRDTPLTDTITDLYGRTAEVTSETCGVIKSIPFGLYVSGDWLTLIKYLVERDGKL